MPQLHPFLFVCFAGLLLSFSCAVLLLLLLQLLAPLLILVMLLLLLIIIIRVLRRHPSYVFKVLPWLASGCILTLKALLS